MNTQRHHVNLALAAFVACGSFLVGCKRQQASEAKASETQSSAVSPVPSQEKSQSTIKSETKGAEATPAEPSFQASFGGAIHFGSDNPIIEVQSFTCIPDLKPSGDILKKGDQLAATISGDEAWSLDTMALPVGKNTIEYPDLAIVKCSDGIHEIVPMVLKAKIDLKEGVTVNSDGYQIEAKRAVKAGDSISVLRIGNSLLSIEAIEGVKDNSEAEPWFTAYKDRIKVTDRSVLVEAWRIENKHVGVTPVAPSNSTRTGGAPLPPPVPRSSIDESAEARAKERPLPPLSLRNSTRTAGAPLPPPVPRSNTGFLVERSDSFAETVAKAEKGDPIAQLDLGKAYSPFRYYSPSQRKEKGIEIERDPKKAFEWFTKAAEQGVPEAQLMLGSCYFTGEGVARDFPAGVEWTRKAAEQGYVNAHSQLGSLYQGGVWVKKDLVQAYAWTALCEKEREPGNVKEKEKQRLSEIERQMTGDQISEAQKLLAELLAKMPKK